MSIKKNSPSSRNDKSTEQLGKIFVEKILIWNNKENNRQMPWKGEKDPYKIWLSEIILQQTRVEQGLNYYENFIMAFPDVHALAKAPEEKVFKSWEGLGYYSRCKNLIITAKFISENLKGNFPRDFDSILQLKGVGHYTASAIASFAYNLPYAVLDGNVFRVISRIFDIGIPIDSAEGKKCFSEQAKKILPPNKAGEYNQAIMDFGATICKPNPECKVCFFNKYCTAYLQGKQHLLPIKGKKLRVKERWLNYFIVKSGHEILIRQRTSKDIWQNLFEFLLIETDKNISIQELLKLFTRQFGIKDFSVVGHQANKQRLTHQLINFNILSLELTAKKKISGFFWINTSELNKYPYPKILQEVVQNI